MKLKHKKLIVIVSLLVIGIGILIFSINKNRNEKKEGLEEDTNSQTTEVTQDTGESEDITEEATQEPEPEFDVNSDPDIVTLITEYMNTKLDPSVEALTPLVSDISLINVEAMEKETNTIESYDNLTVYSIATPQEGTTLVYAYHDIKFVGIDTPAPAATRFLVVKEADTVPYIDNGEISPETDEFIREFEETGTYGALVEDVNTKLTAALDTDQVLAEFYLKMHEGIGEDNPEETTETDASAETVEETEVAETTETVAETEAP